MLPYVGRGNPDSPVIADIDGSGTPVLFTHAVATAAKAFNAQGQELLGTETSNTSPDSTATSQQPLDLIAVNAGSVGDLDGDGLLEYVDGTIAALDLASGSSGAILPRLRSSVSAWSAGYALHLATKKAARRSLRADARRLAPLTTDYQFLTNYTLADIWATARPRSSATTADTW